MHEVLQRGEEREIAGRSLGSTPAELEATQAGGDAAPVAMPQGDGSRGRRTPGAAAGNDV